MPMILLDVRGLSIRHHRLSQPNPSMPVLLSCALVSIGFFTEIFLDSIPLSTLAVVCSALSFLDTPPLCRHQKALNVQGANGSTTIPW